MYVCICNAVKEKQILQAIENGDDTLEKLQASLDVANCCGGCQPMIEGYLDDAKTKQVVMGTLEIHSKVEIYVPNQLDVA